MKFCEYNSVCINHNVHMVKNEEVCSCSFYPRKRNRLNFVEKIGGRYDGADELEQFFKNSRYTYIVPTFIFHWLTHILYVLRSVLKQITELMCDLYVCLHNAINLNKGSLTWSQIQRTLVFNSISKRSIPSQNEILCGENCMHYLGIPVYM